MARFASLVVHVCKSNICRVPAESIKLPIENKQIKLKYCVEEPANDDVESW